MLCLVLSTPLMIPGLQLGEVNGCALVDSEGLAMLISLCCTECLVSLTWPSLSLKNEQKKWGLSCGKCSWLVSHVSHFLHR